MFNFSFEKPYIYIDNLGDKYNFHVFDDYQGNKHFSITVTFLNSKKTIPIFGYEVVAHSFSLPLDNGKIMWGTYDNVKSAPREECMSIDARNIANKMFKLKAFL